ncbi:MAG: head GIN domain-containing protein [Pseudomonadota bacterium]
MQRSLLISILAAGELAVSASAETRTYELPPFNEIDVSSGLTVIFEAGPEQSIVAETEQGDFDKLIIEVEDDTLYIRRPRNGWNWGGNRKNRFTVNVTGPAVSGLDASSGSTATANGFVGDYVEIDASSGATIRASGIAGEIVELDTSSGASISAEGQCSRTSIDASSGASISAGTLECQEVNADASSGATINAYATDRVRGKASSGASIKVRGGASNVDIDKSSGGSFSVS